MAGRLTKVHRLAAQPEPHSLVAMVRHLSLVLGAMLRLHPPMSGGTLISNRMGPRPVGSS